MINKKLPVYTLAYIFSIFFINWGFVFFPTFELSNGTPWAPFTIVVGLVFIIRDFAQREIGHYVLIATLIGCVLAYLTSDPGVAIASAGAFLISEVVDWGVYSFTGKTLAQRILISSAVATPVDTTFFLWAVAYFSPDIDVGGVFHLFSIFVMTASKMIGAIAVYFMIKNKPN